MKFTTTATTKEYFVFGNGRIARVTSVTGAKIYPTEATFFLYDHLGNTRVAFQYSTANVNFPHTVVNAMDYYPYGKMLREYDMGDGDRYLTTNHERDKETGLDYRGARYYDSDVARFLSTDPWANKYPSWSTYNYVMGNPIMLVDPSGKGPTDWFVNKKTGTVIFIKGESTVTQAKLDEMGSKYKPSDYERLGDDKMFGNEVTWGAGNGNILEKSVFALQYQSQNFMESYGYVKAEKASFVEREYISGGRFDCENVTLNSYTIDEVGSRTDTYIKKNSITTFENLKVSNESGRYSSINKVSYDKVVAEGQASPKTAYYSANSTSKQTSSVLGVISVVLDAISEYNKLK
jgi:RHS repeat-associated protein